MTATVHTFPSRPLARGRLAFAETLKATDDPVAASMAMLHAAVAPHEDTPAMQAALARINADFNEHICFKERVGGRKGDDGKRSGGFLGAGINSRAFRARYGRRFEQLRGYDLGASIYLVERALHAERRQHEAEKKAFQIASAITGRSHRPLLSFDVLRELLLILRGIRRYYEPRHYPEIVKLVLGEGDETECAS